MSSSQATETDHMSFSLFKSQMEKANMINTSHGLLSLSVLDSCENTLPRPALVAAFRLHGVENETIWRQQFRWAAPLKALQLETFSENHVFA